MKTFTRILVLLTCTIHFCIAAPFTVISWNVESGGSSPATIADEIKAFQGVDLWGLSEVANPGAATQYESAAGDGESASFSSVIGQTGGADRLLIIYNNTRFSFIRAFEIPDINIGGNVRAPLVARLKDNESNKEFCFMVNHLYRSKAAERHRQATMLNQWARQQDAPVVAVGDYNFDWAAIDGDTKHDRGYDNMIADGVFNWIRPATMVRSQCSETYDSILDFVFVSGEAIGWQSSSEIVVRAGDCPDNAQTSDHRPVRAAFTIPSLAPPVRPGEDQPTPTSPATRAEILARIATLERELQALKQAVQNLP